MSTAAPPLVLFDVDGTLMVTGGATSRCIRQTCERVLGDQFTWSKFAPGLLDPQIFSHLAAASGFDDVSQHQDRYRQMYLQELERELERCRADVQVLPGVRELLDQLGAAQQRGRVVLGLLSGNYAQAVALKLRAAGLDPAVFPITAFAEDGEQRSDLLAVAMRRYAERTGEPPEPANVFIIGDTPNDIRCAHAHGCVSVAVATGWYSADDLREAGADHVVANLADPAPLLSLLWPDARPL